MTKQIDNTLRAALIEAGVKTIPFSNGGTDYPVEVEDLPEATLLRIFDYGKRIFNDAVNGAKHQGKEADTAAKEWLDKAKAGTLGSRSGGARLTPYTKALREIVRDYLKAAGWDAKEAAKDAKDSENAFCKMLELQIARGKGIPAADVTAEDVEAARAKNWPKVEAKAKAMADLATGGLDIEL